jgi:hypothetical protein
MFYIGILGYHKAGLTNFNAKNPVKIKSGHLQLRSWVNVIEVTVLYCFLCRHS